MPYTLEKIVKKIGAYQVFGNDCNQLNKFAEAINLYQQALAGNDDLRAKNYILIANSFEEL